MDTLALKLIITPTLIGFATWVGRRWGPAVSGWLVGIPFTSGPITFFIALSQGTSFAAATDVGILAGTISQAVFCLAYAWIALRFNWLTTIVLSCIVFFIATAALELLTVPLVPLLLLAWGSLALAIFLLPRRSEQAPPIPRPPSRSDIPLRMIVATAFVLLLTGIAPLIGARLTGLLSPFPLYTAILAVFAQRSAGAYPAIKVVRGLLY
ncbi:MAG TPA: hypothetical protein VHD90_27440, partial [Phototrophicaceae bacterium]|nr:hypothetical protein [Phototrophicaceae bacterium]